MDFLISLFDNVVSLLWIILGFGILIFVHELGHFLAAKWAGIRAEGFAVGMGPVMLAWRLGIGLRFGSTLKEYERLAREHIRTNGSENLKTHEREGTLQPEHLYMVGDELGLGETEYSLRWLPIGGFVRMLGQEDANPNYVSEDPRSYNRCPIGKRMIVVSAGVIMNVILAAILFVWAFMVGVRLEAPVIGDVSPTLPAGMTMADNADALGVSAVGLLPGDRVTQIDGKPANTFADLQIASAMSRIDQSVTLTVQRENVSEPLQFTMSPELDPSTGLRSIGVAPGRSTTLMDKDMDGILERTLIVAGVGEQGVGLGMQLLTVDGQSVDSYGQVRQVAARSAGADLATTWTRLDKLGDPDGAALDVTIPVKPEFQTLFVAKKNEDGSRDFETGLLGLTPLVQIRELAPDSHNIDIFRPGDIVLRLADLEGPRQMQFRQELQNHKGEDIELELLRYGIVITVTARVSRKGQLGVFPETADELLVIAQPFAQVADSVAGTPTDDVRATPVADLRLMPRTRIDAINDRPVADWRGLWTALRSETRAAFEQGESATVSMTVTWPTPDRTTETLELELTADEVRALHDLEWTFGLPSYVFDAIYTVRSAEGDPVQALVMGVQETHKLIMMTYLTIDRLIRRTVGVEQLRGPVGIMHIGVNIAERGFIYMLFFLGMISVNLAVINFLPLPIVDGGLFLFLIYEKLKGKPPSIAFQNAATIVGLFLIGTIFIVTFYNDVMRLIG